MLFQLLDIVIFFPILPKPSRPFRNLPTFRWYASEKQGVFCMAKRLESPFYDRHEVLAALPEAEWQALEKLADDDDRTIVEMASRLLRRALREVLAEKEAGHVA
jgi:hypothetical protein